MRWLRRRPTSAERLSVEERRTALTTTIQFVVSDLAWWCRIDGMAGHWVADSEEDAARISAPTTIGDSE